MATFNVENLAPADPQTKFDRLAAQIVKNLRSPDILALEEIQDNSGATADKTVDSTKTSDKLIAAITTAGGPDYSARWVNPQDLTDGGAPGGNIRQVFFCRADRGVGFAVAPAGDALTAERQEPLGSSEAGRHLQAQEVLTFVDQLLAVDPHAKVVALGDINDFEFYDQDSDHDPQVVRLSIRGGRG